MFTFCGKSLYMEHQAWQQIQVLKCFLKLNSWRTGPKMLLCVYKYPKRCTFSCFVCFFRFFLPAACTTSSYRETKQKTHFTRMEINQKIYSSLRWYLRSVPRKKTQPSSNAVRRKVPCARWTSDSSLKKPFRLKHRDFVSKFVLLPSNARVMITNIATEKQHIWTSRRIRYSTYTL